MEDFLTKASEVVLPYAIKFLYALVIFFVGRWLAKLVSKIVAVAMIKAKVGETLAAFVRHIVYYVILIFVCVAVLNKIGIETTPFVAILGAAGLAIGLALQGSLTNFAAGVMLILFHPFKVGDEIEAGGASGIVKEIQIFTTIMETKDNKKVIVPNAKITSDKIVINRQ